MKHLTSLIFAGLAATLALGVWPSTLDTAEAQVVLPTGDDGTTEKKPKKRRKKCTDGKEISADTDGNCCWPGQAYLNDGCIGIPTSCPAGYQAESNECVLPECVAGKVRVQELFCCWPGQAYATTRNQCVGVPQCPEGLSVQGEPCIGDLDQDGIIAEDACPEKAEDFDGFQDDDGCPELDNDKDGIADIDDQCPNDGEDLDGFQDDDGCADNDNDADGIADAKDKCPDEAGVAEQGGCAAVATTEEPKKKKKPDDIDKKPDTPSDPGVSGMAIGGWVAIGVGVLLAGGGGGLVAVASGKRSDVEAALDKEPGVITGMTHAEAVALQDDANTFDTLGVVGISLGGAAIVAGVVMLVLDSGSEEPATTTVTGMIGPNGEGLVIFGGRF